MNIRIWALPLALPMVIGLATAALASEAPTPGNKHIACIYITFQMPTGERAADFGSHDQILRPRNISPAAERENLNCLSKRSETATKLKLPLPFVVENGALKRKVQVVACPLKGGSGRIYVYDETIAPTSSGVYQFEKKHSRNASDKIVRRLCGM